MNFTNCDVCNKQNIPLNETLKVEGKIYCDDCLKENFKLEEDIKGKKIEHQFDETVCSQCKKDFGDEILPKISVYPICKECEKDIRNRTFPFWVKAFLAGILLITVFSLAWNWKYFIAYQNLKASYESLNKGDVEKSYTLIKSVKETVPEDEDINLLYHYFNGIHLLNMDKSSEALKEFNLCRGNLPENYMIDDFILQANIGETFDKKDYEGFLEYSKKLLEKNPKEPTNITSVASAYSCIYVARKDDNAKKEALKYLDMAKKIDNKTKDQLTYYNMIEYRIANKTIITRSEFEKKFPNGWTKN